jgi:putative inorganic carbon (hco3(-)) transporter
MAMEVNHVERFSWPGSSELTAALSDATRVAAYDTAMQGVAKVKDLISSVEGSKVVFASATLSVAVGIAALSARQPIYVFVVLAVIGFTAALIVDPAIGLALFTLMTFFGELVGAASPLKAAGALLLLSWFLQISARERGRAPFLAWSRPQIFYTASAIVVWAVFSIIWAADGGVAESTALRLALNVVLLIVVPTFVSTRRDLLIVVYAYVFGAGLTAFYGIASGNTNTDAAGRLAGGVGDPNELAALLVPGIVLAFVLMPLAKTLFMRASLIVAVAIQAVALVLAQSRGGLIALAAAALAAILWGGRQRRKVLTGVVAAVSSIALYAALGSLSLGRFSSFGGGGTGRVDIWSVALRVFHAHPIQGVGIGNFPVVEGQYAAANLNITRIDLVLDMHKVAHNTYLNVLADLGLVGFVLFVGLLFLVLRAIAARIRVAMSNGDLELEGLARGLLVALIGLLVAYTFISAQYEKQLWLLLGLGLAAADLRNRVSAGADCRG